MNDIIADLKNKFKLSEKGESMLTVSGSAITNYLLHRLSKQQKAGHLLRKNTLQPYANLH